MSRQKEDNYSGSQYINTKAKIALVVGGIGCGFFGLRELIRYIRKRLSDDYYFKKKEEDRRKIREEEQQQAEAQRKSEEEDPMVKLKKRDQEVRAYVFSKLGLDHTNTSEGEHVYARGAEEKRYSRPRLVGRLVSKGDLLFLVSEPGAGKSVLAFQMADDIAEGKESKLFHDPEGHQPPQPVYYWDAEMDSDDMKERYPKGLSSNLIRFPNASYRDGFYLLKHIYEVVSFLSTDATIVLDNWKALCARIDAYYFMKGLRNLQEQFIEKGVRLTIIIVIHTTKEAIKKREVNLGDVAGAAQITQGAKNVLFVTPTCFDQCVELHDAKHRTAKKKEKTLVVLRGGVGTDENLHFEYISRESLEKMECDKPDLKKKKPGRQSTFTEDDDRDIAQRLDRGEKAGDLAKEYNVTEKTIYDRAKRYRKKKK